MAVLAAGLAPPTAQAQTESYITDADEAAACEGVCNTFVPPQTKDECDQLYQDRFYEEYWRNSNSLGRLADAEDEELEASEDTFWEEVDAYRAVLNERIGLAKAFGTGPLSPGAWLLCSGVYTAGMAAAWQALRVEVKGAGEDFAKDQRISRADWEDRDESIGALYDRLVENENARNLSQLALIEEDWRLCLERVNG